jgi:hypothetical protein
MKRTQSQPSRGMAVWNRAKQPEIPNIRFLFMDGLLIALATETEKASMARPMPRNRLLMKKERSNPLLLSDLQDRVNEKALKKDA